MANREYIAFESGKYKRRPSSTDTVDFTSVRIGASNLAISESAGALDVGAVRLTNGATPTAGSDLVTKDYADSIAGGFDPKASVQYATTADLPANTPAGTGVGKTLTADANGALSIDGASPIVGDRILVKDYGGGASSAHNGIYDVTQTGDGSNPWILTRSTDFDENVEVTNGARTLVTLGTVNGGCAHALVTADPITVDTTAQTWSQTSAEVPTATSGSGGAIQGTLTMDSDKGLLIVAGVAEVVLGAASGLAFSAGAVIINLEATNPSLQISSNELGIKFDPAGALTKGAAGTAVNVGDGNEIVGNALRTKSGDETILVDSNGVSVDFTKDLQNDNGGAITERQFVHIETDGNVDLAIATGTYTLASKFGCVADASISAAATGRIYTRPGAPIGGFTGLTIDAPVYLSRTVNGGTQQDLTGFVAGNHVIRLGYAISATEIEFDPTYIVEF